MKVVPLCLGTCKETSPPWGTTSSSRREDGERDRWMVLPLGGAVGVLTASSSQGEDLLTVAAITQVHGLVQSSVCTLIDVYTCSNQPHILKNLIMWNLWDITVAVVLAFKLKRCKTQMIQDVMASSLCQLYINICMQLTEAHVSETFCANWLSVATCSSWDIVSSVLPPVARSR